MQSVKSQIFNYLTKAQKSDLCHFIASFVKKDFAKTTNELAEKFVEDQKYYLEINSTRFSWIQEFIDEPEFLKHLELYIKECQKKYKYKEKQRPLYEEQKAYIKEQQKKVKENKMAKETPTRAQISYYKKLCQKFTFESPIDINNTSKLALRDAIDIILKQDELEDKELILEKLNKIANLHKYK